MLEEIGALAFVLPTSDYPLMSKDDGEPVFIQHIKLCHKVINSKYIHKCALILFLNKEDILRQQIRHGIPFRCFEDQYLRQIGFDTEEIKWEPNVDMIKIPNITFRIVAPRYIRNNCGECV